MKHDVEKKNLCWLNVSEFSYPIQLTSLILTMNNEKSIKQFTDKINKI